MQEHTEAPRPDTTDAAMPEEHLHELVDQLPRYLDNKEARRLHRAATVADQRNEEVLDLESFIEGRVAQLRRRGLAEQDIDEDRFVKVKRLQLARARKRLDAALKDGGFSDIGDARSRILTARRYNELAEEYGRYRADYAQTLAEVSASETHGHR